MSDLRKADRIRSAAVPIFVAAPFLFFTGLAGVHGGGSAEAWAALLGVASIPIGIVVAARGLPRDWRGVAFAFAYLGICVSVFVLAWRDLNGY